MSKGVAVGFKERFGGVEELKVDQTKLSALIND